MQFSDFYQIELGMIRNEELRNTIKYILDNLVDQDNFIKGASSTGRYHPKFALGNQGLVRHTRAMMKVLSSMEPSRPDFNWDDIYSACILHDCCKYSNNEPHTNKDHADMAYKMILKFASTKDGLLKNKLQHIADLVRWHMGIFDTTNENIELLKMHVREDAWIIHYADTIVSRTWYGSKDLFIHNEDTHSYKESQN